MSHRHDFLFVDAQKNTSLAMTGDDSVEKFNEIHFRRSPGYHAKPTELRRRAWSTEMLLHPPLSRYLNPDYNIIVEARLLSSKNPDEVMI